MAKSNQLIIGIGLGLTLGYLLAQCEQKKKSGSREGIRGYFPPVLPDAQPLYPYPLRWAGKQEQDTNKFSSMVV